MKKFIATMISGLIIATLGSAQTAQELFHQEGLASWYGTEFDGQATASGETFDSTKFTAAHPSLPFGTLLLVTNQYNNKQVIVRVNDRGPFISTRIIDLSKAAAEQLDIIASGQAPVVVVYAAKDALVGPIAPPSAPSAPAVTQTPPTTTAPVSTPVTSPAATTQATMPPAAKSSFPPAEIKPGIPLAGTDKRYRLQVGSYKVPRNAVEAFDRLKNVGLNPAYERNGELYRVVLTGIKADDVPAIADKIGQAGFKEALLREER
jgi:rare lipoprotein A